MRKLKHELWPHMVKIPKSNPESVDDYIIDTWLGQNLGPFKERWNVVYNYNSTDFYFKKGSDATMFALRWS